MSNFLDYVESIIPEAEGKGWIVKEKTDCLIRFVQYKKNGKMRKGYDFLRGAWVDDLLLDMSISKYARIRFSDVREILELD